MRDDFSAGVKSALARRVGMRCSNPQCRRPTSGPGMLPGTAVSIGVAAHITGASSGGPRYDAELAMEERGSIANGIWLCGNCARLVDADADRFTTTILLAWKLDAERLACQDLEGLGTILSGSTESIAELIDIVAIRADEIATWMESARERVLRFTVANGGDWEYYWELRKITSGLDTASLGDRLRDLIDQFRRMHAWHLELLQQGHLVAAHDAVGRLLGTVEEFCRFIPGKAQPPRYIFPTEAG